MKKLGIAILCICIALFGCGKTEIAETTVADTTEFIETTVADTAESVETTVADTIETNETANTAEVTVKEQPAEFSIEKAVSVEDYFGGDVIYKADFDGDGKNEICTVKITAHGTQCYVEEIEILREDGEKMVVEHPVTATGKRTFFYKANDYYSIHLSDEFNDIIYPFHTLSTPEEHLMPISFGDIFDYSVIGDKLYFRGSLACGYSEVIGDVIYEYSYLGDALRISRIGYADYINQSGLDLSSVAVNVSLLVDPCIGGEVVSSLPEGEPLVSASAVVKQPEFFVYEKGLTYYVKWRTDPIKEEYEYTKYTLALPAGYTDGEIISDGPGGGSGEIGFLVHAKKGDKDVALWYLFYADRLRAPVDVWENDYLTFTPDSGTVLESVYAYTPYNIARQYVDADKKVMYYIFDVEGGQRIRYDKDKEDGAHPPEVDNALAFADVNFDGNEDICIKLGNFGAQGCAIIRAYLKVGYGKYELCEGFEEIPNPVIDKDNKQILGTNRQNAAEYRYLKYEFDGGKLVNTAELLYNVDENTVEVGGEVLSAEEFTKSGSEWDILNSKWSDIIIKLVY